MHSIPWHPTGTDQSEYTHGPYLFKKKGKPGNVRYQVWRDGRLIDNTLTDEFAVLRWIRDGNPKPWSEGK